MSQWLNSLPNDKRNIYAVLLGIILVTIPCYCAGIAALAAAPERVPPTPTPFGVTVTLIPTQAVPSLDTVEGTLTETPTPAQNGTPTATLEPTPTQLFPTVPPTATPVPTNTGTPTQTPTGTVPPTNTPTPTPTIDMTATAAVIATATAQANATATAAAANATATAQAASQPPVANNDSATLPQDTPAIISVLSNDTDPNDDIDPSTVTVTNAPANGSTSVSGNGKITYTPNSGFVGSDSFSYQVCDTQGACDSATVTITVTAVNSPPNAQDDSATTTEDTPVTIDVVSNDTDPDDNLDPSTLTVTSAPANGSASVNNGQITYTPNSGFVGSDSFSYQVCDTQGACGSATVSITVMAVNSPPNAQDDSATTTEDTPVTIDVVGNDTDPDDNLDPSTLTVTSAPASGSASVNNGQITYTPNSGFTGSDSFSYQVCDTGDACDSATVNITIETSN